MAVHLGTFMWDLVRVPFYAPAYALEPATPVAARLGGVPGKRWEGIGGPVFQVLNPVCLLSGALA